jgi:alpha-aminoadipic semialdehyde synthase
MGLDPGIDHLLAMKFIHNVQESGGKVKSFISWCGGLPAPECSNNPLGYKFSWSPKGVLLAALNSARFKKDGRIVEFENILDNVQENVHIYKGFNFEGIANRDSLKYIDIYGLNPNDMETMFRGTLRYKGFCERMKRLRKYGFLNNSLNSSLVIICIINLARNYLFIRRTKENSFER